MLLDASLFLEEGQWAYLAVGRLRARRHHFMSIRRCEELS